MAAVTDSLLIVTEGAEIPKIIGSKWTNSKTVTMTSDTHITVYDQGNVWTRPSLTYINLSDPLSPQNCHNICNKHWSLSGQVVAAALSPKREFCLLQGASNLVWIVRAAEVGNEVAKGRNLKLPYPVRLVRWLDDIHAAFVTSRYVFHLDNTGITTWDCQTTTEYTEQRVVTDYQQNRLKTWSFVAAVEHAATQSTGTIEVFAMKFDASGTMSGFAAAFMPSPAIKKATTQEVLVADATMDNIIVRYVQLTVTKPSAVKILVHASLEVTSPSTAGGGIQRDFPIGVKVNAGTNSTFAYVITVMGYIHLIDYRKMCCLGSKKLSADGIIPSTSLLSFASSLEGVTVIDCEGKVNKVTINRQHIIPAMLERNLLVEAAQYATEMNEPLGNESFMRVMPALRTGKIDFEVLCRFFTQNAAHLTAEQANRMLDIVFQAAPSTPHHTMLLGHLAAKFVDNVGVDAVITMCDRDSSGQHLFVFLRSFSPKKMSENIMRKFVKVSLKLGQIQALQQKLLKSGKIPHPEAVIDCLCTERAAAGTESAVHALIGEFCIKYGFIVKLVLHRVRHGFPVRLPTLFGSLTKDEMKKQLQLIIEVLLDCTEYLGVLDESLHLELTIEMLQMVYGDVITKLEQNGCRPTELISFLEYLVEKGVPDEPVHSQLAKLYIQNRQHDRLHPFLRMNNLYNALAVGNWCEDNMEPSIALTIYEERGLKDKFVRLSSELGSFRRQLGYLLKSSSEELWKELMSPFNRTRLDLINTMLDMAAVGESAFYDDFGQLEILLKVIASSDLVLETQEFIRRLLPKNYTAEQIRLLHLFSIRSLLQGGFSEDKLEQLFSEKLYSYDARTVAEELIQGRMLHLAKSVLLKGKCWKEAAKLVSTFLEKDIGSLREIADQSQDPDVLAVVADAFLMAGELVQAMQYFLEAGCFVQHRLVCSMVNSDDTFAEWNLLIRFLEGALPIATDKSVRVTLALAYGRTKRIHDLDKLITGERDPAASNNTNVCRICEDEPKNVTFVPCGHMFSCAECSKGLSSCPVCRKPIELKVKTFNA